MMASISGWVAAEAIKARKLRGEKQIYLGTVMILSELTGDGIVVGESKTGVGYIMVERHLWVWKRSWLYPVGETILNLEVIVSITQNIFYDVDTTDGGICSEDWLDLFRVDVTED